MTIYEKLKREQFLSALDEPFQVIDILWDIKRVLNLKKEKEINLKSIEFIRYLLENDLFEVGDYDGMGGFTSWDLDLGETLLKIKSIVDSSENLYENLYWKIFFNLTSEGEKEAKEYLNKQNIIEERILLACQDNVLDIEKTMAFVQEIFATQDPEEIEYEFLDCISSLTGWHFIEVVSFIDNKFQTLKYSAYPEPFENKIKEQLEYQKKSQIKGTMFCRITPKGQLVLDEWKKSGGRISDHFEKILSLTRPKASDLL